MGAKEDPWRFPLFPPLRIQDTPPREQGLDYTSTVETQQSKHKCNRTHTHTHSKRMFSLPTAFQSKLSFSSFSTFPCSRSLIPPCLFPQFLRLHHLTSGPAADSAIQPLIEVGHQCLIVILSGVADAASTYELGSSANPPALPGDLMFSCSH